MIDQVSVKPSSDGVSNIERLICSLSNAIEEELEPGFPGAALTHFLEKSIYRRRIETFAAIDEGRTDQLYG